MNAEPMNQDGVDAGEDDRVIPKQYLVPSVSYTHLTLPTIYSV